MEGHLEVLSHYHHLSCMLAYLSYGHLALDSAKTVFHLLLFFNAFMYVVVVVVPAPWSVSSYGPSQSKGTKQNPSGKVLNTGG